MVLSSNGESVDEEIDEADLLESSVSCLLPSEIKEPEFYKMARKQDEDQPRQGVGIVQPIQMDESFKNRPLLG